VNGVKEVSGEVIAGVAAATGVDLESGSARTAGGGCINTCYRVRGNSGREFFLKLNASGREDMFRAECEGLQALRSAGGVRVPEPIGAGTAGGSAFLLLEYLTLHAGSAGAATVLGAGLARQHRHTAERCGWHRDNTIGSTLQRNSWQADWTEFFGYHRLGFQLRLAARKGAGGDLQDKGARLLERLPEFFGGYRPQPSLLHGDLWAGNWAMTENGEPVIFDPAVYYGDREADLAMTELFGGFPREFYVAYRQAWPLDPGYERRRDIYNLYHVLNHLNLFGGGYLRQAVHLMDRLLASYS
jgi:fructosamine-3-kinase